MALFLLPVFAVGLGAAGIAAVILKRRKSPSNLKDALGLSKLDLPPGMAEETTVNAKEREAMTRAFIKGSDFQWLSTKPGEKTCDPKTLYQITEYMLSCVLQFTQNYGYTLVQRDETTGEYQGSICLIPPYASWTLRHAQFMMTVIPMGKPVPQTLGCDERFDQYMKIDKKHQELMVNNNIQDIQVKESYKNHWHVQNLGVSPEHQGKGIGRKLLQAARQLCVANGGTIYLECHDENVPFYQKMGYERLERFPLTDEDEDDQYYFNAMVLHVPTPSSKPQ